MADFKKSSVAPQNSETTLRPPHDQGMAGPDSCQVCEAPKLGSESIANFSEGPGVSPNTSKIR